MAKPENLNQLERHVIKVLRGRAKRALLQAKDSEIRIRVRHRGPRKSIAWSVGAYDLEPGNIMED